MVLIKVKKEKISIDKWLIRYLLLIPLFYILFALNFILRDIINKDFTYNFDSTCVQNCEWILSEYLFSRLFEIPLLSMTLIPFILDITYEHSTIFIGSFSFFDIFSIILIIYYISIPIVVLGLLFRWIKSKRDKSKK